MNRPDMSDRQTVHGLRWSGRTHVGKFRKQNEDAFLAVTFDMKEVRYLGKDGDGTFDMGDYLFAVSDGMGGANAGEFASRIAVQTMAEVMPNSFKIAAAGFSRGGHDFLYEIFDRIHAEMTKFSRSYEECEGMGATLTLAWMTPNRVYFAHIGDSRLYLLPRDGGIMQVSHDHTHVGWLLRTGKIKPYEARTHPARNQLQQCLGGKNQSIEPQMGVIEYEPGDRFVLCSDGVNDGVGDTRIETVIREPVGKLAEIAPSERIIEEALFGSGRDNITALVVEVL